MATKRHIRHKVLCILCLVVAITLVWHFFIAHTLFLAETAARHHIASMSAPEFFAAYPVLPCADVARAAAYYQDVLGFTVKVVSPDKAYAIIERGNVELHLDSPVYAREHAAGNAECYIWIKGDIDALHADFARRNALQLHPAADRLYQMRDFSCCDLDGNRITFGAEIQHA